MWNRYNYPTVNDADEGGDILILRNNGHKAVYHWVDFCDEKLLAKDIGWMRLPQSDIPQPITITISSGGRTFTIEMVGNRIELHDSRNNKIPIVCADEEGIPGVLYLVESILDDHIRDTPDDDCGCEGEDLLTVRLADGTVQQWHPHDTTWKPAPKGFIFDTPDDDDDDDDDDDCGCEGEGVLVNDIKLQGFIDGLIVGKHRPEPPPPPPPSSGTILIKEGENPWEKNRGK